MVELTFYGGVGEIGGNKILLKDNEDSLFLDFGMSFGEEGVFFSDFLGPKKCNGIEDYVHLGLLPSVKGIYRQDFLEHMKKKPDEAPSVGGVLISHAHVDHIGYLNFLRADIPLYCTPETAAIMEAFETYGSEEYLSIKTSFKHVESKKGGLKRMTSRDEGCVSPRKVETTRKKFRVGDLKITPVPVDHSLPGACAYIIETSAGNIVYTGDLRFHGRNASFSRDFVKKASKAKPVLMLCEGTRIGSEKIDSEKGVLDDATNTISETKALSIVNYPIRDLDRMETFKEAAELNDRRLVVNLKQAVLLELFREQKLKAPLLSECDIYIPRKSWGLVTEDLPRELIEKDYASWERDFLWNSNSITCKDIRKEESAYVWRCDFFELKELLDIKPSKGSSYVRSVVEPFSEEMVLSDQVVKNWLSHFRIKTKLQAHASGHASALELKEMVEKISPDILIPIHTEQPLLFKKFHSNVKIIEKNGRFEL